MLACFRMIVGSQNRHLNLSLDLQCTDDAMMTPFSSQNLNLQMRPNSDSLNTTALAGGPGSA